MTEVHIVTMRNIKSGKHTILAVYAERSEAEDRVRYERARDTFNHHEIEATTHTVEQSGANEQTS